jgi:hypothetical protein
MVQRQAISDTILAANPRPTGIYVILDHENCNPYDSGVLIGSGAQVQVPANWSGPLMWVSNTSITGLSLVAPPPTRRSGG